MNKNNEYNLVKLRKRKDLSQKKLAEQVGVSQSTISRIEKAEYPADIKLLAKIARALDVGINDIVPENFLNNLHEQENQVSFYAFCPSPFCIRNEYYREDGKTYIKWRSYTSYNTSRFDEVNFCTICGDELVKECPNCKKRLEDKGSRFCISCGGRIHKRPTKEEWDKINGILEKTEKREESEDEDIPF